MKQLFKCILFISPLCLQAQSDTSFVKPHSTIDYSVMLGSTGMNNDMLYKLGLGGYISSEAIDRNEDGMGHKSKVGSISNIEMVHYFKVPLFGQQKKFRWRSVGLSYSNAQSAIFSKDAWRLLFRGNTDYLGQTLDIKDLNYTRWSSTSLNASFCLSEKKSRLGKKLSLDFLSFGVDAIHQFNQARFGNSDLYTDTAGSYINTRLQGAYALGNENQSLDGFGLHIGAGFKAGKLSFSIDRMGLAYMGQLKSYRINAEETFGGDYINIDDIQVKTINQLEIERSQLNSGNWINKQRDTIVNTFVPSEESVSALRLLPFVVQAKLEAADKQSIWTLYYQYINGMLPYISYQYRLFNTALGYMYASGSVGGFDTYDLGVQLKIKPKPNTHIDIDFRGIEALVAPQSTHGTVIGIKLKQYWD